MKTIIRTLSALVLTFCLLINTACFGGALSRAQDLLPYIPAAIDFAVSKGTINAQLGAALKDDISSGTTAVTTAKQCLSANEKQDVTCYLELGDTWRQIVARNHFAQAGDPKVVAIIALVDQLIKLVVRKNTQPAGVRGAQDFDKQIEDTVKKLEKELEPYK